MDWSSGKVNEELGGVGPLEAGSPSAPDKCRRVMVLSAIIHPIDKFPWQRSNAEATTQNCQIIRQDEAGTARSKSLVRVSSAVATPSKRSAPRQTAAAKHKTFRISPCDPVSPRLGNSTLGHRIIPLDIIGGVEVTSSIFI